MLFLPYEVILCVSHQKMKKETHGHLDCFHVTSNRAWNLSGIDQSIQEYNVNFYQVQGQVKARSVHLVLKESFCKQKESWYLVKMSVIFPCYSICLLSQWPQCFSLPGRWPLYVLMRHCVKMCLLMSEENLLHFFPLLFWASLCSNSTREEKSQ